MKMKNCGCHNVRKHIDIKDSEKYIALYNSLKFGSQDNMRITSSESKYYLGGSGKGLVASMGLKTNVRSKREKNSSYAITNVSMKDISNNIN